MESTPEATRDKPLDGRCPEDRSDFLLEMYRQTSTHLGRHVTGVWQCVGVVGAAFAVFALEKDKTLSDFACALVILLNAWLAATTLDASNWFNRNLTIIANIERLYLSPADTVLVHPFFGSHRRPGKLAEHFRIQLLLSAAVTLLVLVYHFYERVKPGLGLPLSMFDPPRCLPYLVAAVCAVACGLLNRTFTRKDSDLQRKAPGYQAPI